MLRWFAYALWFAIPLVIYLLVIKPRLHVGFFETYLKLPFFEKWQARLYAFRTFLIGIGGMVLQVITDLGPVAATLDIDPKWRTWIILGATIAAMLLARAVSTTPEGVKVDE